MIGFLSQRFIDSRKLITNQDIDAFRRTVPGNIYGGLFRRIVQGDRRTIPERYSGNFIGGQLKRMVTEN